MGDNENKPLPEIPLPKNALEAACEIIQRSAVSREDARERVPQWRISPDGKKKDLGGRWSKRLIKQTLEESPNVVFSLDDLARLVYGSTSKRNRDSVRKRIPIQRNYMLLRFSPMITKYGINGRVQGIKFYDSSNSSDRDAMGDELEQRLHRKEITTDRYHMLLEIYQLSPPLKNA